MTEHHHIEGDNNVAGSRITAGGDVMVGGDKTTNIYYNADYKALVERIEELEEDLAEIPLEKVARRLKKSQKLEILKKRQRDFRQEIIRLAETFTRIEIKGERLKQAKTLFEAGKFKEADTLLNYDDLKGDQERLLHIKEENEEALRINANEFLVKAQTTAVDYENPNRFEDTCRYYEASIQSEENKDNLFGYAYFLADHNQNKEAQHHYERYLGLFKSSLSQGRLATALNNLGILHKDRNEYPQAEQAYQEALETYRQLAAANPQTYLPDVAMTLNNLGILHWKRNDYSQAEQAYQEALEIKRQLAADNPQTYLPDVAMTLNNLGILHWKRNDYSQAEQVLKEALEIGRQLAADNPQTYLPDLSDTLIALGNLQSDRNEYSEAEKSYQEALKIRRKLAIPNPQVHLPRVAMTLNNLGVLHYNRNEYPQAEQAYQEALEIRRQLTAGNPQTYLPDVAQTLNNLGVLHYNRNEYPQAEQAYQEALEIRRQL
ncbi:MAG: tetratricopeptide repeat protein, partial [Bacteroidota bacterium]